MSKRYAGYCTAATAVDVTFMTLHHSTVTTVRPRLYELVIGAPSTPADQYVEWKIKRATALGTEGGGFTPVPLDPSDVAAIADYGIAVFSAEPTYTANAELLAFGLNTRATFRWVAAPDCELIVPATASNCIGLLPDLAGGTAVHSATMFHVE